MVCNATVMGVLTPLITPETVVISDALNHNSIINALRLSRPKRKEIYRHLDMDQLDARLEACAADCRRAIVITDGIFSMRGDHAPLDEIVEIARRHDDAYAEKAAAFLVGTHDFESFRSQGTALKSTVRTMTRLDVTQEGEYLLVTAAANGFLYNMVRAIVGTLVEVGRGKLVPEEVRDILAARDRSRGGPTAPARGLCLEYVTY